MMKRLLGAALVFAASLTWTLASGRQQGDFRIDEAHKLSETYYFRLVREEQLHHPDWLGSLVERTNPPLGKYLFGAAIATAGLPLPNDLTVADEVNHGRRLPPRAMLPRYHQYLRPVRFFVALVTALTAALVFLLGCEMAGFWCGGIGALLYGASFLTEAFSATASFDPLLTLFVVAAALPALMILRTESAALQALLAAGCGLASAAAFSVRVTGLLALAGVLVVFATWGLVTEKIRRALVLVLVAGLSCDLVAIAINPYYWTTSSDARLAPELRISESFPTRIVRRGIIQFRDLRTLEARELREQSPLRGLAKARFVSEYVFGDAAGMILLVGIALLAGRLLLRRHVKIAHLLVIVWSATIVAVLTAWLPFGYPRYVLVTIPPFALLAALGWSTLVELAAGALQKRRAIELATRSTAAE